MSRSSLEVIEEFMGEALDDTTGKRLATGPADHIIQLAYKLSESWDGLIEQRFTSDRLIEEPYFVPAYGRRAPAVSHYKQLALYYPKIAVPDPLEAVVAIPMMAWAATNMIIPSLFQEKVAIGLRRLVTIAPLVRAGALELVPADHAGLSSHAQSIARQIFGAAPAAEQDSNNPLYFENSEYAATIGLCTSMAYWPVCGSEVLWNRLHSEGAAFVNSIRSKDIVAQHAVAQFNLPSTARVPLDDLLRVRADSAAFADLRRAIGITLAEAVRVAQQDGADHATELLRERLEPHRLRCEEEAKRTTALDGVLLPTGAVLGAAGLSWAFGFNPVGEVKDAVAVLTNAVAPSAVWLTTVFFQQLGRRRKVSRSAAAIYGALLETNLPEIAEDEGDNAAWGLPLPGTRTD